jgi:fatty acid desaturase
VSEPLHVRDPAALRRALRAALPAEAFEPQPLRGIVALCEVPLMVAIGWLLAAVPLHWSLKLLCALVQGQLMTSLALSAGHENLHRSVFRSRFWESVVGAIGVSPFLITPGVWRAWHVHAHHANTNAPGRDPDCLRTVEAHAQSRFARFIHAVSPGSGHPLSFVAFFVLLTFEGQLFLWYYSGRPEYRHIPMNRARERVLTLLVIAGWVALGARLGLEASFWAIALPMLTANFTLLCYIATNHWLSPATPDENNPFLNSLSTTTHPLFDWIHFNFSYHQEHHLFPGMSGRHLPRVRAALRELEPAASVVHPQWRAVLALFRKPALYLDAQTLSGPGGRRPVAVSSIPGALLNQGQGDRAA